MSTFKKAITVTMTLSFLIPQAALQAHAQTAPVTPATTSDLLKEIPADLFPVDSIFNNNKKDDKTDSKTDGKSATATTTPAAAGTAQKAEPVRAATVMGSAKVPEAYACPVFENPAYQELTMAIDSLSKEVKAANECVNNASATAVESNAKIVKESISVVQTAMMSQDPASISVAEIEKGVTSSIQAVQELGNILSNSTFLNSNCGRQAMSSGKALLAFNNVINGLSPYALFAVSMNAALTPALPFVVGGIALTTGISVLGQMYNSTQNGIDMNLPEHRKAIVQNTCQFIKVAKKVRFMQLAQTGKIDKVTEELESSIRNYTLKFSQPAPELYPLLKLRASMNASLAGFISQYEGDRKEFISIDQQMAQNPDDLMMCTLARELTNWAQDDKVFPASALINIEQASKVVKSNTRLQVGAMRSLHMTSMKRIVDLADKVSSDESSVKACAVAARSWMAGLRQTLHLTSQMLTGEIRRVETELNQNPAYRLWKNQYDKVKAESVTVTRVQTAMKELARDQSIIDRSEFAQRMVNLKAGLFGRDAWAIGNPPVMAWLDHTKSIHDRAISSFEKSWKALYSGAWSISRSNHARLYRDRDGVSISPYEANANITQEVQGLESLRNLNLETLPRGTRENVLACQQLESAWLDWSAAIDHIGATQYFCNMIDEVLDVKMDRSIVEFCRGKPMLNGKSTAYSVPEQAQMTLQQKGFSEKASIVSKKLKELQCPMPNISVLE